MAENNKPNDRNRRDPKPGRPLPKQAPSGQERVGNDRGDRMDDDDDRITQRNPRQHRDEPQEP
ncbi:MAG: hypothetical protein ACTHU0_03960 [Kofleriaceae bacterium]